jgi:hypothetical protein
MTCPKQKKYIKRIHPEAPKGESQVIFRKMFIIVDNKHKPIVHRDGHLLIFYRAKDATSWLFNNPDKAKIGWRVVKMEVDITKV